MLNNDDLVDIIHQLDGRSLSKFAGAMLEIEELR
jgi:hypothetical protein